MQGRLRNESLAFDITSECACCGLPIRFRMGHDLAFDVDEEGCDPLFFVPMVDFTKLKRPSIIDDF